MLLQQIFSVATSLKNEDSAEFDTSLKNTWNSVVQLQFDPSLFQNPQEGHVLLMPEVLVKAFHVIMEIADDLFNKEDYWLQVSRAYLLSRCSFVIIFHIVRIYTAHDLYQCPFKPENREKYFKILMQLMSKFGSSHELDRDIFRLQIRFTISGVEALSLYGNHGEKTLKEFFTGCHFTFANASIGSVLDHCFSLLSKQITVTTRLWDLFYPIYSFMVLMFSAIIDKAFPKFIENYFKSEQDTGSIKFFAFQLNLMVDMFGHYKDFLYEEKIAVLSDLEKYYKNLEKTTFMNVLFHKERRRDMIKRALSKIQEFQYFDHIAFGLLTKESFLRAELRRLRNFIQEGKRKCAIPEVKEIVVVLGNTGAGKSLSVAGMLGADISYRKDVYVTREITISGPRQYPEICVDAISIKSVTTFPEIWPNEDDSVLSYLDCPGFDHTRPDENLGISLLLQSVLASKNCDVRALLFLINWKDVSGNKGKSWLRQMETMYLYFKENGLEMIKNHCIFALTHLECVPPEHPEELAKMVEQFKKEFEKALRGLRKEMPNGEFERWKSRKTVLNMILEVWNQNTISFLNPCDKGVSYTALKAKLETIKGDRRLNGAFNLEFPGESKEFWNSLNDRASSLIGDLNVEMNTIREQYNLLQSLTIEDKSLKGIAAEIENNKRRMHCIETDINKITQKRDEDLNTYNEQISTEEKLLQEASQCFEQLNTEILALNERNDQLHREFSEQLLNFPRKADLHDIISRIDRIGEEKLRVVRAKYDRRRELKVINQWLARADDRKNELQSKLKLEMELRNEWNSNHKLSQEITKLQTEMISELNELLILDCSDEPIVDFVVEVGEINESFHFDYATNKTSRVTIQNESEESSLRSLEYATRPPPICKLVLECDNPSSLTVQLPAGFYNSSNATFQFDLPSTEKESTELGESLDRRKPEFVNFSFLFQRSTKETSLLHCKIYCPVCYMPGNPARISFLKESIEEYDQDLKRLAELIQPIRLQNLSKSIERITKDISKNEEERDFKTTAKSDLNTLIADSNQTLKALRDEENELRYQRDQCQSECDNFVSELKNTRDTAIQWVSSQLASKNDALQGVKEEIERSKKQIFESESLKTLCVDLNSKSISTLEDTMLNYKEIIVSLERTHDELIRLKQKRTDCSEMVKSSRQMIELIYDVFGNLHINLGEVAPFVQKIIVLWSLRLAHEDAEMKSNC